MGANIEAEGPNETAPLRIKGAPLRGIDYTMPIASAQVKGALFSPDFLRKAKRL